MSFKKINITDISPAEYNPRKISNKELSKLTNSLNEFGLVDPIIINLKNNKIIGGHQRYDVLLTAYNTDNTYKELYLIELGDIGWVFAETDIRIKDENTEKALNLALNNITGEWDNDKLKIVLQDLQVNKFNINLTGFEEIDLEELDLLDKDFNEVQEDEYEYDENISCTVKQGDLYKLDNHYLMCNDSLNEENVLKLLQGNKVDMVWTDPFYDIQVDVLDYLLKFCNKHLFILQRDTAHAEMIKNHYTNFKRFFALTYNQPIWSNFSLNTPLIHCTLLGHYVGEEAVNPKQVKGLKTHIHNSVLEERTKEFSYGKPLCFITPFIKFYSKKNNNILDLFGGSGSCLIACEEMNRNCFMMELEPVNVQNIINRWEQHTGKKAVKIN